MEKPRRFRDPQSQPPVFCGLCLSNRQVKGACIGRSLGFRCRAQEFLGPYRSASVQGKDPNFPAH